MKAVKSNFNVKNNASAMEWLLVAGCCGNNCHFCWRTGTIQVRNTVLFVTFRGHDQRLILCWEPFSKAPVHKIIP